MTDSKEQRQPRGLVTAASARATEPAPVDVVIEPYLEQSELVRRWSVLKRYLPLFPLAFAAGFAVAWYLRSDDTPVYQAHATVRFRDTRATMTSGVGNDRDMLYNYRFDPVKSQIELLGARTTRERAVDEGLLQFRPVLPASVNLLSRVSATRISRDDTLRLKFSDREVSATFGTREAKAVYGTPVILDELSFVVVGKPTIDSAVFAVTPREMAIAQLSAAIVSRRPDTDIGDFVMRGSDPIFVPRALNALTLSLQSLSRTSDQQFVGDRRKFLDDQLRQADSILETKRLQLAAFRTRTQTFDSRQQVSQEQQTLGSLRTRREELNADKQVFESLLNSAVAARSNGDASRLKSLIGAPGISENPLLVDLYTRMQRFSDSRDSLTRGPFPAAESNPDVQRLTTQIDATANEFVEAVRNQVSTFEARIAALDALASKTTVTASALPATQAEEERLEQETRATQILADQLRMEQQRARISELAEGGKVEVIDLAPAAGILVSRSSTKKLVYGGLLGVALLIGIIFLYEELNTSLRRKSDVEHLLSLPTLGSIPSLNRDGAKMSNRLLGRGSPKKNGAGTALVSNASSPVFESYRAIRTSLIFSNAVESLRTIAITSASPGDGKSTTVANLAVAFAQQDLRILAIDCDFRRGSLHRHFSLPRAPGFTNAIATGVDLQTVVRETTIPNLSILTTGVQPPNPGELLGSHRVRELLAEARDQYDLLIIDTPPVLAAADAAIIASMVDGVILLIRVGVTTKTAAKTAEERLRLVGARMLGTVLNDPTEILDAADQYYYYDYTAKGPTAKA